MATEVRAAPFEEIRAAVVDGVGTAVPATGLALSTTRAYAILPKGTKHLALTAHTFAASGSVVGVCLNPYLQVFVTQDALATQPFDASDILQDSASTALTLSSFSTLANKDFLLVGSHLQFGGVYVNVGTANSEAATITVEYWNGSAWASISPTDGTISGGASLAVDGAVTWTVPTNWPTASLENIAQRGALDPVPGPYYGRNDPTLYWTRWTWDIALTTTVTIVSMNSINRSTNRWPLISGQALELGIHQGIGAHGCVEAVVDTGTAKLNVAVASLKGGSFA